jgi:hypothetical protein
MIKFKYFEANVRSANNKNYSRKVEVRTGMCPSVVVKYKIKGYFSNDTIKVYAYYQENEKDKNIVIESCEIVYGSGGYKLDEVKCDIERMTYFIDALKNAQVVAEILKEYTCSNKEE